MDNPKVPASDRDAHGELGGSTDLNIGPGVGTLLNGTKRVKHPEGPPIEPASNPALRSRLKLLRWSLLAADLALIGLLVYAVLHTPPARILLRLVMCVVALSLGAWLGSMAFWWKPDVTERLCGNERQDRL
jgi:hypothetical protein